MLEEARKNRGISLEEAEKATKIRLKYLDALEKEDFELLPGKVYAKGFLKNYAQYLGLDVREIVEQYDAHYANQGGQEEFVIPEAREPKKKKPWIALASVAVLCVGVVGLFYAFGGNGNHTAPLKQPQSALQEQQQNQSPGESQLSTEKDEKKKQQGLDITLNVTDSESWMKVEVDGNVQFTGTLGAGESKHFQGQNKVFVWVGKANVVQVTLNGENLGALGEQPSVVRKEFLAG